MTICLMVQVQNILLLHNERIETIEAAAVATTPLLPPQQGSATQIPCSRITEPATNYSGGEDCGALPSHLQLPQLNGILSLSLISESDH